MTSEKVFVSGSISIKTLPKAVCDRLINIISKNMHVLVGDALGIDFLVQKFFADREYYNVTVYSIASNPRNLYSSRFNIKSVDVSDDIKKERERQQCKDKQMSQDSDYSLIIWDCESKGSYANILRSLELDKRIVVFLNKEQQFLSQDKCTVPEVEFIYRRYNGYTSSEVVEYFQNERIYHFENVKELHKFLIKNKIIVKDDKKYKPCLELSREEQERYFIKTQYKGKDTGINYTNALIEWLEYKLKTLETEQAIVQQESLF